MRSQTSDPITHHINATNAKKLALLMVIGFTIYHGILHVSYGIDSCKWLLSDGRFQGYHIWQPYGCMLHNYTKIDSRMCMRYIAYWGGHNDIVFMGDSRIRQLYFAFTKLVSTKEVSPYLAHHDLSFEEKDLNLKVHFSWNPVLNESVFNKYRSWLNDDPSNRPKIVVTGAATWTIKTSNASLEAFESYKTNMTRLLSLMDKCGNSGSQILWVLQDPVVAEKLSPSAAMITNEQIDLYNKAALDVLKYSTSDGVHVWSSARLVSQGSYYDTIDGLHMGDLALGYAIQILLNMYCNDQMNYNDGTCCADPEPITVIQIATFSVFSIFLTIAIILATHRTFFKKREHKWSLLVNQEEEHDHEDDHHIMNNNIPLVNMSRSPLLGNSSPLSLSPNGDTMMSHNGEMPLPRNGDMSLSHHGDDVPSVSIIQVPPTSYYDLIVCVGKFGLILTYVFICDRTNFFMKENKFYTHSNFFLALAYVLSLGLFFTESSPQVSIMSRDQTNEWKGWMQLVILIYHMTGASQVLPIYVMIRLLVTTYLFLTGFGHFNYFWHKPDAGLHRLWQVMFRLNLLVICLCLAMNRPYQFYYFVPLVSFWYLTIYVTMTCIPRVNARSVEANPVHYLYMVLKLLVLFAVVTILYMSEVFFEKIFLTRPWKALFVTTDDSISEWWFRWRIDRYSVPSGMVFAFIYEVLKSYHVMDEFSNYLFPKFISIAATLASVVGLVMYAAFALMCHNKAECNEIHPYVSFVPIVCFVVLRNISSLLRTRYSAFFAWFGKISLELFICQYHIWLAANTHGVLVLVPSYPVLNVIVTMFIFVCVCHEIHNLTRKLTIYAIPNDWRYMARNLAIFLLIIIPIGIKDGMF